MDSNWLARYEESMLGVFGAPAMVLTRGEGVYVEDADGKIGRASCRERV